MVYGKVKLTKKESTTSLWLESMFKIWAFNYIVKWYKFQVENEADLKHISNIFENKGVWNGFLDSASINIYLSNLEDGTQN